MYENQEIFKRRTNFGSKTNPLKKVTQQQQQCNERSSANRHKKSAAHKFVFYQNSYFLLQLPFIDDGCKEQLSSVLILPFSTLARSLHRLFFFFSISFSFFGKQIHITSRNGVKVVYYQLSYSPSPPCRSHAFSAAKKNIKEPSRPRAEQKRKSLGMVAM